MEKEIILRMTVEQAEATQRALDLFSRVCTGQLEELENLVIEGVIPLGRNATMPRAVAAADTCDQVRRALRDIKNTLDYPSKGSHGIAHPHVCIEGRRSYELLKVLSKALAENRNPNPTFRSVNYDGLGPRYTQDPAPVAFVRDTVNHN